MSSESEDAAAEAGPSNTAPLAGENVLLATDHYDDHVLAILQRIAGVSTAPYQPCS